MLRRFTLSFSTLFLIIIVVAFTTLSKTGLPIFYAISLIIALLLTLLNVISTVRNYLGGKLIGEVDYKKLERDEQRYVQLLLTRFEKREQQFFHVHGDFEVATEYFTATSNYSDLDTVLLEHNRFVLLGASGVGKTAALQHFWRQQAQAFLRGESSRVPLWINLGRGHNPELAPQLFEEWWTKDAHLPGDFDLQRQNGNVFLFLDGLNEMPGTTREYRTKSLRNFIEENPNIPIIVTCRSRDYEVHTMHLGLPVVHIHPLDDKQIRGYIETHGGDQTLWDHIKRQNIPRPLVNNVYNLTKLIKIYNLNKTIPTDLDALFSRYLEQIYQDYKSKKLVRSSWKHLKSNLQKLAFSMLNEEKGTEADENWCKRKVGSRVLQDAVSAGILIAEIGQIRFYHQSLQHYFALPELINILQSKWKHRFLAEDSEINFIRAIGGLGKVGESATPVLIQELQQGNRQVRFETCWALGRIGDSRGIAPLIEALNDEDDHIRFGAARGLEVIGKPAVEPLLNTLQDTDKHVRFEVSKVLGHIGDIRAVEPLLKMLEDTALGVESMAAQALGQIGDVRAVEPLIAILQDEHKDDHLRSRVAEALGHIGDARAIDLLITTLDDDNLEVWSKSAEALGHIGDARAIAPLIASLNNSSGRLVSASVAALVSIGESAIEPLLKTLPSSSEMVQEQVIEVLGELGSDRAIPVLTELLTSDNELVRVEAKWALDKINASNHSVIR